jgi:hypothetical protein
MPFDADAAFSASVENGNQQATPFIAVGCGCGIADRLLLRWRRPWSWTLNFSVEQTPAERIETLEGTLHCVKSHC